MTCCVASSDVERCKASKPSLDATRFSRQAAYKAITAVMNTAVMNIARNALGNSHTNPHSNPHTNPHDMSARSSAQASIDIKGIGPLVGRGLHGCFGFGRWREGISLPLSFDGGIVDSPRACCCPARSIFFVLCCTVVRTATVRFVLCFSSRVAEMGCL